MAIHKFTFDINAENGDKAREVALAVDAILKGTATDDLLWVAKNVKEIPSLFKKIKNHPFANTFLKSLK